VNPVAANQLGGIAAKAPKGRILLCLQSRSLSGTGQRSISATVGAVGRSVDDDED